MKRIFLLLVAVILVGTACTAKEDNNTSSQEAPQPIEVEILTPDTLEAGKEITIEAKVTQGKEAVEDADEVLFELWKDGDENHDEIEGTHQGEGIYSIKQTFPEDGVYYVIAHVTARNMHNMPKKELIVGDVSHGHHHGDNEGLVLHIQLEKEIRVNEETTLTAHVMEEGKPLEKATVKFEVWKKNEKGKHNFLEAKEGQPGEYQTKTTFSSKGEYVVKLHMEKGKLHEHSEETITVK